MERRAWELLDLVGLDGRAGELAANFSYGDQRRLEIARALATEPRVLLLDEPAAGMNTSEKGQLTAFIREVRDSNGKLLHRTHSNLSQALDPQAAKEATGVLRRAHGTRCFTGATGSERDAWTLRLGATGSTAIWIGFDQPAAIAAEQRLRSLLDEFVQRLGNG